MRPHVVFTLVDFFIPRSRTASHREDLIKSRIFVLGVLLLAAISLMDLIRLGLHGKIMSGWAEALDILFAGLSLACHYRFGRPQYFILPFALALVVLLNITIIGPANSLLAPAIQWLPLIAGAVFFVSGRWWGCLFSMLMILMTLWIHRDHMNAPVNLPSNQTLQQFVNDVPIVLFQVLAAVSIMALAYISLHRQARVELSSVQSQVAQALRSAENSDFSHNLRSRINLHLKPLRARLTEAKNMTTDDCILHLQELRNVLADLRDYTVLQRSVHESDAAGPVGLITWEECVRRIRSLLPGRHGLLSIHYEDSFETTPTYKLDSRLIPVLLEGLRLLCYQTQAEGSALLQLSTHILGQELALILNLTLEEHELIPPEEKVLNEQKLELTSRMLQQNLQKQGGTLQTRQKDKSYWLQIAIPLPTRMT